MDWLLAIALALWLLTWRTLCRERKRNNQKTIKEMVDNISIQKTILVLEFKDDQYIKFGGINNPEHYKILLKAVSNMKKQDAINPRKGRYKIASPHFEISFINPKDVVAFIDSEY